MADTIRDGIFSNLVSSRALHIVASKAGLALARAILAIVASVGGIRLLPRLLLLSFLELHVVAICGDGVRHNLTGQVVTVFGLVGFARDLLADCLLFLHFFLLKFSSC